MLCCASLPIQVVHGTLEFRTRVLSHSCCIRAYWHLSHKRKQLTYLLRKCCNYVWGFKRKGLELGYWKMLAMGTLEKYTTDRIRNSALVYKTFFPQASKNLLPIYIKGNGDKIFFFKSQSPYYPKPSLYRELSHGGFLHLDNMMSVVQQFLSHK